jgi:uncharacterized protein (UPF0332 family)
MKGETRAALEQAHRTFRGARILFDEGLPDMAAAEAYYAMFHAATAALAELGQGYSKHSAVISAFGREFAKTGLYPACFRCLLPPPILSTRRTAPQPARASPIGMKTKV